MKGILGKKLGMTQIFAEDGTVIPVTVVEAGPVTVVQKKTKEKEGYDAIKVGYQSLKDKFANKPHKGQFAKASIEPKKYLREFDSEEVSAYEIGQEIKADVFSEGEKVDISGVSKGKGFQGTIKRHGQHRGPMTHGSKYHRGPGSMGSSAYPSKVFKGKNLPGHMGHVKVTVQNLEVVRVDAEKNILLIKGAVPGPKGGLLTIQKSVKNSK